MTGPVRDTAAMIAGMAPERQPGVWVFCRIDAQGDASHVLREAALATLREPEGLSVLVPREVALAHDLGAGLPMAHILLRVNSALDGVGLTAAVASTLADAGIPCNVVAGIGHDHLFVPLGRADEAIRRLEARASRVPPR